MTYEEWVEKYRPIKNELSENASYDGTMFETFGDELDMVRATPDPRCIWTLICGEATTISSGWHLVNRMGYFITEVPFEDDFLEIDLDDPEEDLPDAEAMIEIQQIMSGKEWTPDTLNEIADVMRRAGYTIEDTCPGHIGSDEDRTVCQYCGIHIEEERPDNKEEN